MRNEALRLPWFLDYYRAMGIRHFLVVDNGSDDGGRDYLSGQEDVSVWLAHTSYKAARFGMDWLNWLLHRHGAGHWCLTVDPDEFLVYPHHDTRPLQALTDWLDASNIRSFSAMLLDMYPRGSLVAQPYRAGQDPSRSRAGSTRPITSSARTANTAICGSRAGLGPGPFSPTTPKMRRR